MNTLDRQPKELDPEGRYGGDELYDIGHVEDHDDYSEESNADSFWRPQEERESTKRRGNDSPLNRFE